MMRNQSWATVLVVGVLSRLVVINGGPAVHHQSRPMRMSDEQQIERMYEMLDSHHKRAAAAAAAASAQQTSTRRQSHSDSDTSTDDEAHTEHLPKFHYEVHHVAHKFGHDTPADIKLRDVARHAAVASDDDDDDDDEETSPADAADQLQTPGRQRLAPVGATQLRSTDYEYKHPLVAPADYDPAVDKKRDEEVNYNSEPQLKQTDLRDSMDSYYGQYEGDVDEAENNIQGQAERRVDRADRDSSNSLPSPVSDVYFVAVVVGCSVAGLSGLLVAAVCWYRLHKKMKATSEVDYPAYGVTGPSLPANGKDSRTGGSPGDRKLAQSAQMYHYQHQKQQMIASERVSHEATPHVDGGSDVESEDDNEDGDYTVFECRGLATNGEMEVRNPMFTDQPDNTSQAKK